MPSKSSNPADEWSGRTIVGVPLKSSSSMFPMVLERPDVDGMRDVAAERSLFKIRLADSDGRRSSASFLIDRMYSWRGYDTSGVGLSSNPNKVTLVASTGESPIGTMSLSLDSPGVGLPADEIYRPELDQLRKQGRRLCEPTKLAIDQEVRSKRVLASLIHISFIYAYRMHGYTDYVIEINPRHVAFYKKMLGFEDFGEQRLCERVNAPAVLLRLDLDHMKRGIERFGGQAEGVGKEKSLYPYFFSTSEEKGITKRLFEVA